MLWMSIYRAKRFLVVFCRLRVELTNQGSLNVLRWRANPLCLLQHCGWANEGKDDETHGKDKHIINLQFDGRCDGRTGPRVRGVHQ